MRRKVISQIVEYLRRIDATLKPVEGRFASLTSTFEARNV
jgi:hypothetical protein